MPWANLIARGSGEVFSVLVCSSGFPVRFRLWFSKRLRP
jgi:hypothetical protein